MSPATNEEFTGMVNGLARLARPQSGWDPYEVWRTRVKGFLHCDAAAQTRPVTRAAGLERSAYAEALFLEKLRAQVTLNSIGDAVIRIDVAGNVTYLNPAAESMMGWSRQEASGRPLQDVAISGPARNGANAGSGSRLRRSLSFLTTA
ncbi:MAG: PAS domain-containing protein [Gammaproteobacteria bacterium]|nr:MAG: PAS domain-containing protein [Gammaproteobacteria bacterium]